jgi:hypothetical protein
VEEVAGDDEVVGFVGFDEMGEAVEVALCIAFGNR